MRQYRRRALVLLAFVCLLIMVITSVAFAEATQPSATQPAAAINLTDIVSAVFALLASLITYKLVPWIRSKTSASQQALLQAAINTAVYAAEQIYGAGNGDKKLAYALDALKLKGYYVESKSVKDGVEAAVKAMTLQQQLAEPIAGITLGTAPDR